MAMCNCNENNIHKNAILYTSICILKKINLTCESVIAPEMLVLMLHLAAKLDRGVGRPQRNCLKLQELINTVASVVATPAAAVAALHGHHWHVSQSAGIDMHDTILELGG